MKQAWFSTRRALLRGGVMGLALVALAGSSGCEGRARDTSKPQAPVAKSVPHVAVLDVSGLSLIHISEPTRPY